MRIVSNAGTDRVVDLIQPWLRPGHRMDLASEALSLHAFAELADRLPGVTNAAKSGVLELLRSVATTRTRTAFLEQHGLGNARSL